jgi:hypothetical protein
MPLGQQEKEVIGATLNAMKTFIGHIKNIMPSIVNGRGSVLEILRTARLFIPQYDHLLPFLQMAVENSTDAEENFLRLMEDILKIMEDKIAEEPAEPKNDPSKN